MDGRDRDILRRAGYGVGSEPTFAEAYIEKKEVPLKLLRDLVNQTLSEMAMKEGVSPPEVRWTAETFYRKPVLFVAMIPSTMGGPFITFPAWFELALREDYGRFEPHIRYIFAHEFKHYLQDLAGMYKKQEEMWKEGKFFDYPFEEEAYEYAHRYTGMTKPEYLRLGDEATAIIRERAKAGVRVVV